MIRAGTKSAEGVPEADMIKRARVSSFFISTLYVLYSFVMQNSLS